MFKGHRIGALLLMAGKGDRFQSSLPKQFHLLQGTKIYLHTLEKFLDAKVFDEILLVCSEEWIETVQKETCHFPQVRAVLGGASRQLSSHQGLKQFLEKPHLVSIHDAVRPFVSIKILIDNLEKALLYGAVDTCIPIPDTIVYAPNKETLTSIPKREEFFRGQTPQTFLFDWIIEAHTIAIKEHKTESTDDCRLIHELLQRKIFIVSGEELNFKITSPFDLEIAANIIKNLYYYINI